ncbi:hypothetical protein [Streptomyces antibioticus]|uniref:hypothetical protein n=1 Tax=Streptomyces antibioticus TaxID=1890 RepID=UPI003402AC7F
MAEVLITVEYKTAEGSKGYLSVPIPEVEPEDFSDSVSEASEIIAEFGLCPEAEPGHFVFVPAHAIHRADFQLIQEPDAQTKS